MAFTDMLCLQIYHGLLLKSIYQELQKSWNVTCLKHHCERSQKLCYWSSTQINVFIDRSWNSEYAGL